MTKRYNLTLTLPLKRLQYSNMTEQEALEMQHTWDHKHRPLRAVITEMEDTEDVHKER